MNRYFFGPIATFSLFLLLGACSLSEDSSKAGVKEFNLYIGDVEQELSPGQTLYSWGYGLWDEANNKPATPATVPGPELRVQAGDHVKVVLHNKQKEPHTIHFHGVDNSFEGDGTPDVSQAEVEENGVFTYEFDAKETGTYFYHCHVEPDRHVEMGLYGAVIVDPKKKQEYAGESVLFLGERDPKLSLAEGTEAGQPVGTAAEHEILDSEYDTLNRHAEFYTINGKAGDAIPPIVVKEGGKYLIRLINAGAEVHSIHLHGHHFQVIESDGRPLPQPITKDTITIGPGERYDIELTADNPGVWPMHCHMGPHATHGMHMYLVYEGYEDKTSGHMHSSDSSDSESAESVDNGLHAMTESLDQLRKSVANGNSNEILKAGEQLFNDWASFEEEVKKSDQELYETMENVLMPVIAGTKVKQPDAVLLSKLMDQLAKELQIASSH